MNKPNSILFAGEILDGRDPDHPRAVLLDGTAQLVRVRTMPARHHLDLLDLFHVGREADLIQRCVEVGTEGEAGQRTWSPVDAAWVDSLEHDSHARLAQVCEVLNLDKAIATAQRQVARGQSLRPVMDLIAQSMLAPMRAELGSWMSSLTTQLSAALAEKKP